MGRLPLQLALFGSLLALAASFSAFPSWHHMKPAPETREWPDSDEVPSLEVEASIEIDEDFDDDDDDSESDDDDDGYDDDDNDNEMGIDGFIARFMPNYDAATVLELLRETSLKLQQLPAAQEISDIQDGSGVRDETAEVFVKQFLTQLKDVSGFRIPRPQPVSEEEEEQKWDTSDSDEEMKKTIAGIKGFWKKLMAQAFGQDGGKWKGEPDAWKKPWHDHDGNKQDGNYPQDDSASGSNGGEYDPWGKGKQGFEDKPRWHDRVQEGPADDLGWKWRGHHKGHRRCKGKKNGHGYHHFG